LIVATRSSAFHAREVEVVGAAHLSRAEIVAAAGVSRQTNVVWFDESAVEARLERLPWVASADVGIAFPLSIRITVTERVPIAVASDGLRETLVAGDGTLLGPADRPGGLPRIRLPSTPVFEGPPASPAPAARALAAMAPGLRSRLSSVTVLADGTLELRLEGVVVDYGAASEPRAKAEALERVLAWAAGEGAALATVNVVAPELPAVKLAN
jgi:cell division protein FtsQ